MSQGWNESAAAWIAAQGEAGDFARRAVLDPAMMERVIGRGFRAALDVGCGEGRFCRRLAAHGIDAIGIDPTPALIDEARRRHPAGDYRLGRAEALGVADRSFDLVVSYLSLIDIPDAAAAIAEMARVLRPEGTLLIANMNGFVTAGPPDGWQRDATGNSIFPIDHYLEERADWVAWAGIRVKNWHRPLGRYMALLLAQGLTLRHFSEPEPRADTDLAARLRYRRVPLFHVMEWRKDSPRTASPGLEAAHRA